MSFFIVPKQGDIVVWLHDNSVSAQTMEHGRGPGWHRLPKDYLYVCLVDNGNQFSAAVVYSEFEYTKLTNPEDNRPKTWFMVRTSNLVKEWPDLASVLSVVDTLKPRPKLYRFYITDTFDGDVKGTDNEEWAKSIALSPDFFVVDTETGEWLSEDGDRREVQGLPESDEDPD